jgi:hypothetical protein
MNHVARQQYDARPDIVTFTVEDKPEGYKRRPWVYEKSRKQNIMNEKLGRSVIQASNAVQTLGKVAAFIDPELALPIYKYGIAMKSSGRLFRRAGKIYDKVNTQKKFDLRNISERDADKIRENVQSIGLAIYK